MMKNGGLKVKLEVRALSGNSHLSGVAGREREDGPQSVPLAEGMD
jgi:hypothetical protein